MDALEVFALAMAAIAALISILMTFMTAKIFFRGRINLSPSRVVLIVTLLGAAVVLILGVLLLPADRGAVASVTAAILAVGAALYATERSDTRERKAWQRSTLLEAHFEFLDAQTHAMRILLPLWKEGSVPPELTNILHRLEDAQVRLSLVASQEVTSAAEQLCTQTGRRPGTNKPIKETIDWRAKERSLRKSYLESARKELRRS